MTHNDYPHEPGRLYDCEGCEEKCYCTKDSSECVHCALVNEEMQLTQGIDDSTWKDTVHQMIFSHPHKEIPL